MEHHANLLEIRLGTREAVFPLLALSAHAFVGRTEVDEPYHLTTVCSASAAIVRSTPRAKASCVASSLWESTYAWQSQHAHAPKMSGDFIPSALTPMMRK